MKNDTKDVLNRIQDYALEEIMGLRFGAYAKEIIQDRAIPDVRDGLKPVQRRILFDMYKNNNTYEKGYVKCAYTVGSVLGKYHPHGDSSVYDAMIRMSQWWKQNEILVDIHGNNGSMDGDSPAAYRYTEARLSKISIELLKDLDKNTVAFAPNFDDRFLEPTVLPAKFPNLLVNGTNGISAGYATNIPPHNLGEVIDATIKRIESPNCRLETILDIVKGPDFPTGGIVEGKNGIIDAFKTGRGKVIVRSKVEFVKSQSKEQIIVTEIPFDVNKQNLVKKIDDIRIDKKIEGIAEVRDETDKDGLRIAIDLKKGVKKEIILNYLLKNTDLSISYNYNMVAIVNRRPMTLGILAILDAYIAHKKEVIIKRSEFDLLNYKTNLHIIEGLIKALDILDDVIKTIRASKNKADAKINLVNNYDFTMEQAEAIVDLQLYKLTNTDVSELESKLEQLTQFINALESILNDPEKLKEVMKHELKKIKKEYATERRTEIHDEITDIKLEKTHLIPKVKTYVIVTNEGYLKRVSPKSYAAKNDETTLKPGDFITHVYETDTLSNLILFTSLGRYLFIPVHEIAECKWKELGKHVNNLRNIESKETIIGSLIYNDKDIVTMFTKNGQVKRTYLKDMFVTRFSKPMTAIKLKNDDELLFITTDTNDSLIVTNNGYYLRYSSKEIPIVGIKASGVKGINLKDDKVVFASNIGEKEYLVIFNNSNGLKRIKLDSLNTLTRAKKGNMLFKKLKTVDIKLTSGLLTTSKSNIGLKTDEDLISIKTSDVPIKDLTNTFSNVVSKKIIKPYIIYGEEKISFEEEKDKTEEKNIKEKKEEKIKELTISDFIDEFKI